MQIGRGAYASFELWSNNDAFGNKVFAEEGKCAEERAKFLMLIERKIPILPPIVLPWTAKKSIAMMRMDMTLEHALQHRLLSGPVLQHVVFAVTDLLLLLSDDRMLMMDVHLGNILLQWPSNRREGMPRVVLNDPGFMHDFSDPETLPKHVRRCAFDPQYDLAFFSYSLLGFMRRLQYKPLPITPLSESELIPYQHYIKTHRWDMAVGHYPYRPDATLSVEDIARNSKRRKVASEG